MTEEKNALKIKAMRIALAGGFALMLIKFGAYYFTHSTAILTDAIESIINVAAGSFALYSLYIASLPRDENHPYGHGKIEFFAAGFEGALITLAGVGILIKAGYSFFHPTHLHSLDWGVGLTLLGGAGNWALGAYLIRVGRKNHSLTLIADGRHLLTDTYSSLALAAGLVLIAFTNFIMLDAIIALVLAGIILFTGFKLMRESISGLMDETDMELIFLIAQQVQDNRRDEWIDIHHLRAVRYGSLVHVDCHVTMPRFKLFEEIYAETLLVEKVVQSAIKTKLEISIFAEPCEPSACTFCNLANCPVRTKAFQKKIDWTTHNLTSEEQHFTINNKNN